MKNLLTLSLLCTTLVPASLHAEQPTYTQINEELGECRVSADITSERNFIYKIEAFDEYGSITALIAVDAFRQSLQVGDAIITMNDNDWYVESIEPSEDPAYLRVVLSIRLLETCSEQEEQE
jgi:hypothetical protein